MTEKAFVQAIREALKNTSFDKVGYSTIHSYDLSYDDSHKFIRYTKKYEQSILKIRGVYAIKCFIKVYGGIYIIIYSKPCKEFVSLQKYLLKYAGYKLTEIDIMDEHISGKRSLYDVDGVTLLHTNPTKCKQILDWCKTNKHYGNILKVAPTDSIYYGDRFNSYGEDRECEWSGYRSHGIQIEVFTASGRKTKSTEFHI